MSRLGPRSEFRNATDNEDFHPSEAEAKAYPSLDGGPCCHIVSYGYASAAAAKVGVRFSSGKYRIGCDPAEYSYKMMVLVVMYGVAAGRNVTYSSYTRGYIEGHRIASESYLLNVLRKSLQVSLFVQSSCIRAVITGKFQ
jgi:hypothetical protein